MLVEAALGLLALLLLAVCLLAWRLAQGPIDLTWLMRREQAFVSIPGARLSLGGADLAWEGFDAKDQPLTVRLRDVGLTYQDGGPTVHVALARVRFVEGMLLLGRCMPRSVSIYGAALDLHRAADGSLVLGQVGHANPATQAGTAPGRATLPWPAQLERLHVEGAGIVLHDAALGVDGQAVDWHAADVALDLNRDADGGLGGSGHALLQLGGVHTRLDLQAVSKSGETQVTAALAPVDLAAVAAASPKLAPVGHLGAVLSARLTATLNGHLQPTSGTLALDVGPGTLAVAQGSVRLASASVSISANESSVHLDQARIALAGIGAGKPGPVISATAEATRADGRVHAGFGVDIDRVAMADLAEYWPAGTGGGARPWLTRNVTAGAATQGHVTGELTAKDDLSDIALVALSGGLALDDATVWWLRPVPPIMHAHARVTIEGPDALRITVQDARQDGLAMRTGSSFRITGLQVHDQFGDIDAGLSGPVADALAILNNARLRLLSRGGVEVVDPAGTVHAELTMHVPLEDKVSMDDIPVSATAVLTGVHLGRLVAGRDLDDAHLSTKVTGNGLTVTGDGVVAGIPAKLALDMDFRGGPPTQVVQHLTAQGIATPAQLLAAGLPPAAVHVLTGGSTGLRVDYTGRRSALSTLQVDADLGQASVATPFGWSKPVGQAASAGGLVTLDHGRLAGVDNLHAEGPGLAIDSHAEVSGGSRILHLKRLELGRTSAHGQIAFPVKPGGPVGVVLSGQSLDLSAYFAKTANPTASGEEPGPGKARIDQPGSDAAIDEDDKPGLPWSAKLDFGQVVLAHATTLSPLHVDAASDGRRILHAAVSAGAPGTLTASVVPVRTGRHVTAASADAGQALASVGATGLNGGTLKLDGSYDDSKPGAPLTGTVAMDNFNLRDAPTIGRLLQVMTLYGVADTMHGPGLHFSHLVAPFRWKRRVLHLSNARAFSPSLGITADGDVDFAKRRADMRGTVVPAYFFNQLLGDLPLIGRLFSPEKGGGLFAARYSVRGPLADPKVGINPLSALTPGFLRGLFGVFDTKPAGDHVQ